MIQKTWNSARKQRVSCYHTSAAIYSVIQSAPWAKLPEKVCHHVVVITWRGEVEVEAGSDNNPQPAVRHVARLQTEGHHALPQLVGVLSL